MAYAGFVALQGAESVGGGGDILCFSSVCNMLSNSLCISVMTQSEKAVTRV